MDAFFTTDEINIYNGTLRLLLGLIAGGLIGINRESKNRAAGFRTHILICLGSSLIMILSVYIPQELLHFKSGDPGRIAAQVVTGIGFLGAGAIIKFGDHVKGLTTAASIWVSAALGLAIGAGMLWLSFITLALVLITLIILEKAERMMFRKHIFKVLFIQVKQSSANLNPFEEILHKYHITYEIQEFKQNTYLGIANLEINIKVDSHFPLQEFINTVSAIPNVQEVSVKSKM